MTFVALGFLKVAQRIYFRIFDTKYYQKPILHRATFTLTWLLTPAIFGGSFFCHGPLAEVL